MQHLLPVGKDERQSDISWRLLTSARQSRQNDLLGLPLDYLLDRHPLDSILRNQSLERRRFQDAQPDVKPHCHHYDAEHERYPQPQTRNWSPESQLKNNTARLASKRPPGPPNCGADEAAMLVGARPFHRQQNRTAPFAADTDPLDEADDGQNDRAPDANRAVSRNETHGEG